ncbi:hypothetical protein ACJDT4_09395 [Clostridium neuense]|uniref:Uncharacterized protein n=1 Tax=Clostridium neuense TaxID=1728934 RepID=A0ABW8TDT7_9CLOT
MEEFSVDNMSKFEEELYIRYLQKERECKKMIEQAEIFGAMKEDINIALKLIGKVRDETISEVTGINIGHIKCLKH